MNRPLTIYQTIKQEFEGLEDTKIVETLKRLN